MNNSIIRVLLIDDDEDEFVVTRTLLSEIETAEYRLDWVSTYEEGLAAIARNAADVYLVDFRLGGRDGIELLSEANCLGVEAPLILLTGHGRYEIDLQALNAGASDYLVKAQLTASLLDRSIRYSLEHKQAQVRITRAASRADALARVAARLNGQLKTETVLETLCQGAIRALHVEPASVSLFDERRHVFQHTWGCGLPPDYIPHPAPIPEHHIGYANDQYLPVLFTADVSSQQEDHHFTHYHPETRSLACTLIARDHQPVGLLHVFTFKHLRTFNGDELALLKGIADQAALALTSARLYEEERTRSNELAALAQISASLRQTPTMQSMLPIILSEARKYLNSDTGAVILVNRKDMRYEISLADGILSFSQGLTFDQNEGISSMVAEQHRPYVTEDYASEPRRLDKIPNACEIGPAVFVPLESEVEMLGTLMLGRSRGRNVLPYTPSETHLLAAIGEIAGNALRRARLYDEIQRQVRYTQALNEIDKAITSTLDLRWTLHVALTQVMAQLNIHAACVLLLNPATGLLEYTAGTGFRTMGIQQTAAELGMGHAGQAALERKTVHVANLYETPTFLRKALLEGEDFYSYYGVPLIAKNEVKGVLELFHRAPLDPDDEWLEFMETLAAHIAMAVDNAVLFDSLQNKNLELAEAYETTLEGWSRALDLRDKETEGHTQRVTEMTIQLAENMGVTNIELVHMRRGALLHDIGKMGIPDHILLKPGPLTDDEWDVMRQHTTYAYQLLQPIEYLHPALDIPYCHHEKWDGTGYPRQLKGEQIPFPARVFAVVDVWDALLSDRPYRPAWPIDEAISYIQEQSGQHFDPQVSEAFLKMVTTIS